MRRAARALVALSLASAVLALPRVSEAQGNRRTGVTITGFPRTVTSTTPDDFDAGFVSLGSTTFTVQLRTNAGAGGFSPRVTTVNVRCGAPCPGTAGQLQWRRADLGVWNSLSTAFNTVESRTATFNGINDPWTNSIEWRYVLLWATTPPAAQVQYPIDFELVVTAP